MAKRTQMIPAILPYNAEGAPAACPTCCRSAHAPARVYDARGSVVQGCVAEFHTGALIQISESNRWHLRPEAKKIRRDTAAFYRGV